MNKRLIRLTEQDIHRIVKESVQAIIVTESNGKGVNNWGNKSLPYGFQDDGHGGRIHVNHKGKIDGWNNGEYGCGRIESPREVKKHKRETNGWKDQYVSDRGYIQSKGSGKNKQFRIIPRSMKESISEWSPYPKNKDYRKKAERAKIVPNPNPYDDKKGWGKKIDKTKDDDWYINESMNLSSRYLHKVITESAQKLIFEEGDYADKDGRIFRNHQNWHVKRVPFRESFVPSNYYDDEDVDDSLSDVERGYPNHWMKEMHGTDEEFDAFMRWAMTDGNDYGFGDAAGEYVNDGEQMKLHNVAMQYARTFKIHPEKAFNMAKEAAEGIYGFANDMRDNAIDMRGMKIN